MGTDYSSVPGQSGPQEPTLGHVAHSVQILFTPHAVLGYATSIRSRSTSIETDISHADISSLPSSVGSGGDMPRCETQFGDYKSAMGGMTLDLVSSTRAGE